MIVVSSIDCYDRIVEALSFARAGARQQLEAAARLAGAQLELMLPAVLATSPRGLISGSFADVPRGTIVAVVASQHAVAQIRVPAQPGRATTLAGLAQHARGHLKTLAASPAGTIASAIKLFVKEYGGDPGACTNPAPPRAAGNMFGMLFGLLPPAQAPRVLGAVEDVVATGACPAIIGLIGPGLSGTPGSLCGAWPLLLNVAPYIQQFEDALLADGDRQ